MENARRQLQIGSVYGLASAALFGAATPLSKLLLPGVGPLMLAALLYLGAAIFISVYRLCRLLIRKQRVSEARLRGSDVPVLCAIIALGGVFGPVLMLFGLSRISAMAGSLLLNLEAVFTIAIAVFAFQEHLGLSSLAASIFVVLGALLLGYQPSGVHSDTLGILAIVGACLCWAIDNNPSQRLSVRDPTAVVQVKTAGAGATSMMLAQVSGHVVPTPAFLIDSLLLGGLSYGVSLVFVMLAFRHLGAARKAAWFSTAPFIGAALSIPLFGVLPKVPELIGTLFMASGIFLLVGERHGHAHTHEILEHDHVHSHDEHHMHEHDGSVIRPHSHPHRHDSITHKHLHASDLHHRHQHA
jgi:drug/metabolite transporter (DMT)-like permease